MSRALFLFAFSVPAWVALAALAACSQPAGSGDAPPPSTATESASTAPPQEESRAAGTPIATVMTQDARVTILTTGGNELRFVVRKADGAIVADGISAEALRSADPILHAIVTSAVASAPGTAARADKAKTYVDATLDRPMREAQAGSSQRRW